MTRKRSNQTSSTKQRTTLPMMTSKNYWKFKKKEPKTTLLSRDAPTS
jgi:hypothetical protein